MAAKADEVEAAVERCPSGALRTRRIGVFAAERQQPIEVRASADGTPPPPTPPPPNPTPTPPPNHPPPVPSLWRVRISSRLSVLYEGERPRFAGVANAEQDLLRRHAQEGRIS